jgi:hypothetical protein
MRAALLAIVISGLAGVLPVEAAVLIVRDPADSGGSCPGSSCTLRQALATAASGDIIQFEPGITTITLTSGELLINNNLTIEGPGANRLTVRRSNLEGTPQFRIFNIAAGQFNVTISDLTIANGNVSGDGGGIFNQSTGTVAVTRCTISDNRANHTSGGGGGICNAFNRSSGALKVTACTISGNSAAGASFASGGGVLNGGVLEITNCTISGNSALTGGGAYNYYAMTLASSTICGNSAVQGGGVYNLKKSSFSPFIELDAFNTIIARNTATSDSPDYSGSLDGAGYSLIGDTKGTLLFFLTNYGGNQFNVDPKLDPRGLRDNGGPTFTVALAADSPALNKGDNSRTRPEPSAANMDQRGFPRPSGSPNGTGNGSDIGAFEIQKPSLLANVSTRLEVQGGDNALFAGFIITGVPGSGRKVLLRGLGPSLSRFGIAGTLSDPLLELHVGSLTIMNDNWRDASMESDLPPGFAPSDPRESVLIARLQPGSYSAILKGAHGESGVGVIEVYDLGPDFSQPAQLANLASRGVVQSRSNVLTGGFIIGGNDPFEVLVRALGPSLANFGLQSVLADPELELHDSNGTVWSNDDWRSAQETQIVATGLQPTYDKESALRASLAPGNYTVIVRGKDDAPGITVLEIYSFP